MDTLHESDAAAAATELYWGSDKSVNQIAEELELSKSALYGLIRPMPAGLGCPECGQEAVSPNRTARDKELLACPGCGWEGPESAANSFGGEGAVTLPTYAPVDAIDDVDAPPVERTDSSLNRMVMGGALLGAAAGLALVFWARRRA